MQELGFTLVATKTALILVVPLIIAMIVCATEPFWGKSPWVHRIVAVVIPVFVFGTWVLFLK